MPVNRRQDARAPTSRAEALAVFRGTDECLDHLGVLEVAAECVQLGQPELKA